MRRAVEGTIEDRRARRGGQTPRAALRRVLRNSAFRLLWAGQGTSYLGDQFYLIALPWLVLQLTGDPLALGTVLAAAGVPRGVLMLLGGAITDRFSPRRVMIISDLGRLVLTALLAILVLAGEVELWSLYAFALAFGCMAGLFMPASSAIVPYILDKGDLQTGNALAQGTAQLAAFLGPLLAGGTFLLLAGSTNSSHETGGIAVAFGIDSFTFLVSVLTLWLIGPLLRAGQEAMVRVPLMESEGGGRPKARATMLVSIKEGFRYVWSNGLLRTVLVVVAVMNLLCTGPLFVGIPVLASRRLPEGAAALGILMSAYAGGNLAGCALAGSLPIPRQLSVFVPLILTSFGVVLCVLGVLNSTPLLALLLLSLGVGYGYVSIVLVTWLQQSTPQEMLGRIMSLMLFSSMGFVPLSQVVAGALVDWSLAGLFLGAGALVVTVAALLSLSGELHRAQL